MITPILNRIKILKLNNTNDVGYAPINTDATPDNNTVDITWNESGKSFEALSVQATPNGNDVDITW